MKQTHLNECHSTQEYLKLQVEQGETEYPTLVSTEVQTHGIGRRGNHWNDLGGTLCFSGLFPVKTELTLAPLELATHLITYFKHKHQIDLRLKWPNDILNEMQKKVGGILLHHVANQLVVGFGINFLKNERTPEPQFDFPHDYIFNKKNTPTFDKKKLAADIYLYLLNEYLADNFSPSDWNQYCIHLKQKVEISDENKITQGWFMGINSDGSALLKTGEQILKFYSGTLRFSGLQK